jgi:xanthine dehydrogenase accessory factor
MSTELSQLVVLIRGGGEVASGVAHKLARVHFRVCLTETSQPLAVSRGVAFCEAIYDGEKEVEGVVARRVESVSEIPKVWQESQIPIIIDPEASVKDTINPDVLVDAIMAKRNLGTKITDAPLVIGLGPGFHAGRDVHMVVETNNSESLGRVILSGEAEKDTGIPIAIGGLTFERALHSPRDGLFQTDKGIGDLVTAGEVVASVTGQPAKAEISGVVRALLRSGTVVEKGTKLGEIDPSGDKEACYTIRPRVRAIAGGVLEAIMMRYNSLEVAK